MRITGCILYNTDCVLEIIIYNDQPEKEIRKRNYEDMFCCKAAQTDSSVVTVCVAAVDQL